MIHARFGEFWTATLVFETLTDLHVGSGDVGTFQWTDSAGETQDSEYARFARDADNELCIPGSTLKGAAAALEGGDNEFLFGVSPQEGSEGETGEAGRLIFLLASRSDGPGETDLPNWDPNRHTWIRVRHARDPDTGAVAHQKLFHTELAPPGTKFTGHVIFTGSEDDLQDKVKAHLRRLATGNGFEIGANRNVMGRLRLASREIVFSGKALQLRDRAEGSTPLLEIARRETTVSLGECTQTQPNLRVDFTGPVAIIDPPAQTNSQNDEGTTQPALRYSERNLAGFETALRQFMRQRCAWLEVTKDWASRDRLDNPDAVVRRHHEIADLTSTQRLFGVAGFRGLISLHVFAATSAGERRFPGIALDALTQGVLEGRTFFVEAATGVTVRALIALDSARHQGAVLPNKVHADLELLARLCLDLRENGVRVGRRSGAGFGWSSAINLKLRDCEREGV